MSTPYIYLHVNVILFSGDCSLVSMPKCITQRIDLFSTIENLILLKSSLFMKTWSYHVWFSIFPYLAWCLISLSLLLSIYLCSIVLAFHAQIGKKCMFLWIWDCFKFLDNYFVCQPESDIFNSSSSHHFPTVIYSNVQSIISDLLKHDCFSTLTYCWHNEVLNLWPQTFLKWQFPFLWMLYCLIAK